MLSNKMYKFGLAQQGTPIRAATLVSPPAPIVTVTGATYTGATLSWSGSNGTYTIVGSTGNTYSGGLTLASKLTKTVAFVKLPQGGTYTARVFASAGGTYTTASASVPIFVPYKPVTVPIIKTTTIGYSGVTLTWSASVSNTTEITYQYRRFGDDYYTTRSLTGFIPLTAGATYSISVGATAPGQTGGMEFIPKTVFIPLPAKPSVPVLTASSIAFTSTKLSWTAQTVKQPLANSVTYDIVGTGVTYASGLTVLSTSVRIPAGNNSIKVVARAGLTFAESAPITVTVPVQKPTVPVLSQPILGSTGGQVSWTAATGNSPITYSVVSALGGTTYATGLIGTSTVIPNSSFTSYGSYPIKVVAIAGTTYSVSAGATLGVTLAPPDDIVVNYLSTQGCQLSWVAPAINTGVSYSISELTGATFSIVQGPTFESASGLWLAGVSFGSAQVYDFFISGSMSGITGPTSEIVVYVAPHKNYESKFYRNPGTYTVTVPPRYSGFQVELVGGGGGGSWGGAGGGAGGFCLGSISAQPGATFALVVGAGGTGGILIGENNTAGSAGGTSSIANFIAGGGDGAVRWASSVNGGAASGGTVNIQRDNNAQGTAGAYGHLILGQPRGSGGNRSNTAGVTANAGRAGCALITFFP
jgi:hypothetical protein